MNEKKIYLDACSWCRPYDDLSEPRNYIEYETVLEILRLCKASGWTLAASEVIETELMRIKDAEKLENVKELYKGATAYLTLTDEIRTLAKQFQQRGIKDFDSLHLATAEINAYDVLLTTDDDFLSVAQKISLHVKVSNPLKWFLEET